jgi:hypothetical protein
VLDALSDPSQRSTALKLVRESYDRGPRKANVEEILIRGAQAKILGEPVKSGGFVPVKGPADRVTFEGMALAWLTWAQGADPVPVLDSLREPNEYGGAIHLMALEHWGRAIRALEREDGEDIERCFRRSIELGAQYGLETADAIQWSYAASVFHRGT